jgi:protein-tyrosine phosphatase
MRRIYALGDFADLCAESRSWRAILPTRPWLEQVVEETAAARGTVVPRDADDIDVVDPFRQSDRVHEEAFARIEEQLDVVVTALASVVGSARA